MSQARAFVHIFDFEISARIRNEKEEIGFISAEGLQTTLQLLKERQESMYTIKEKDAIRFYEGDTRRRGEGGILLDGTKLEGYYGISSAYRTINCLMFDGTENEKERIKENNGRLKPEMFLDINKTIEVYCDIFRAMCKSAIGSVSTVNKIVYRTERGVSLEELKKGHIVSFTSTSKENKPEDFLVKKSGLVLLNFVIPPHTPYLDFEEVLGEEYLYSRQKEILLPPFLRIELKEVELSEEEKTYLDAGNMPPRAKYLVLIKGFIDKYEEAENKTCEPLQPERNKRAAEILEKLIRQEQLGAEEEEEYCLWKRDVRAVIWEEFTKIRKEYFDSEEDTDTVYKDQLLADITKRRDEYNERRKQYKQKTKLCRNGLIIANIVPLVLVALSFIESVEDVMRVIAIVAEAVDVWLAQVLRAEVYNEKLMQRTATYLRLCDLRREVKYERIWNADKQETYVKKFREIMLEDTRMSLHNLEVQTKYVEEIYPSSLKKEL